MVSLSMKKMMTVAMCLVGANAFAGGFELKGDAAKGETSFKTFCVACHGEKGDGTGPAGAALNPKPANFTDAKRAAEITDEYVYKMISEGGAANGRSPLMASWKAALNDQQIRDVAAYVRHFAPKADPKKDAAPAKKPAAPVKK
jgi:cytochrome c oxidase cbb3-type subunit 3